MTSEEALCAKSHIKVCRWSVQPQVEHMTAKWHVYMTLDGRISMAGLNQASCRYLAEAMKDAITSA